MNEVCPHTAAGWGVHAYMYEGVRGRGVGSEVCPIGGTINPQVMLTERLWYLLTSYSDPAPLRSLTDTSTVLTTGTYCLYPV